MTNHVRIVLTLTNGILTSDRIETVDHEADGTTRVELAASLRTIPAREEAFVIDVDGIRRWVNPNHIVSGHLIEANAS